LKKIKKAMKVFAFVCMLLLALAGIGLPIPFFNRDRLSGDKFYDEQIDDAREDKDDILEL
jgi:hypothetical protein